MPHFAMNRLDFDRLPYEEALALQHRLRERVLAGGEAQLLLLEHPPTITLGRRANEKNILNLQAVMTSGTALVHTDRGGDVTWHGPGQLVGYPILELRRYRLGVRRYVGLLAEVLQGVLEELGIAATWEEQNPGLWVGEDKIAAFGVNVHRGVTTHGFSLNVDCELSAFQLIRPCGIMGRGVTSMAAVLGHAPPMAAVRDRVATLLHQALELLRERSSPE